MVGEGKREREREKEEKGEMIAVQCNLDRVKLVKCDEMWCKSQWKCGNEHVGCVIRWI